MIGGFVVPDGPVPDIMEWTARTSLSLRHGARPMINASGIWRRWALIIMAVASACPAAPAMAAETPERDADLSRQPSWSIPAATTVRARMLEWIARRDGDAATLAVARSLWNDDRAPHDVLDAAVETFALLDPRCAPIGNLAKDPRGDVAIDVGWLTAAAPSAADDPETFQRETLRLWLGRHFVRHDRFDEGLEMLSGMSVQDALDPAALLFHQAACSFWLLDADRAIDLLDQLLERAGEIPVRYERTARLLRADIAALEDDSLDHIARRMRDITRRLDLGRAGPKTRGVQDGVIASLDKLIAKIEEQQCQCQSSSGAGASGRGGNGSPMDDSRIAEGKGPGEVKNRDLGDGEGWGNLPPHQREEALQQIGREFPPHYREAIEQYFKRLAAGGTDR